MRGRINLTGPNGVSSSKMAAKHGLVVGIDCYPYLPQSSQLEGAVRDAEFAHQVLTERFGFSEPKLLLNEDATREAILREMYEMVRRVEPGDEAFFHFSGHGSQLQDLDGDEADGYDETLVPFDSGRGGHPNRDLVDDEIHRWLVELTATTDRAVLVIDACHSGSISRRLCGARIRRAPVDGPRTVPGSTRKGSPSPSAGASGWLSPARLGERYTLIAACRDMEAAHEERFAEDDGCHGALSRALYSTLAHAPAYCSYRDVFEEVTALVTGRYPLQHPQLEGVSDRKLFAAGRGRPALAPPRRAVTQRVIGVALDPEVTTRMPAISEILDRSSVLKHDSASPDLRVVLKRLENWDGPEDPRLGWAILGGDGSIRPPVVPLEEPYAQNRLLSNLATWARYLRFVELGNPDPASRLRRRIRLKVWRMGADGEWQDAPEGEAIHLIEGDTIGLEVHSGHAEPVYPAVLGLELDGRVQPIYPPAGAAEELRPGGSLRIGMRRGGPFLRATLPEALRSLPGPWTFFVKVFAATTPPDLSGLPLDAARTLDAPGPSGPAASALNEAWMGLTSRHVAPLASGTAEDWTCVVRSIHLHSRPHAEQGGHVGSDGGGQVAGPARS